MLGRMMQFEIKGDARGSLISLESFKNIPFDIKRVYYIFNTKPDVRRGYHAHKSLEQILVCVSGKCSILLDDGQQKEIVELDSCKEGLYINSFLWREMFDFSQECVLMVLASEIYDESDYIRNYKEFLDYVK